MMKYFNLFLSIGMILILIIWTMYLIHLYQKEKLRADILQEQLDIRRQIERGNRADKIIWKYHNVAYLNHNYNIKLKNLKNKQTSLNGGIK